MDKHTAEQLALYAEELGWRTTLTVTDLIKSHRAIRRNYQDLQAITVDDMHKRAKAIAKDFYGSEYYVSVADLSKMTIQELADRVGPTSE